METSSTVKIENHSREGQYFIDVERKEEEFSEKFDIADDEFVTSLIIRRELDEVVNISGSYTHESLLLNESGLTA
jgi:hypothetical protein